MGGEMAAFRLWEERDSEVSSVSVDGLTPLAVSASQLLGGGQQRPCWHWHPLSKVVSYSFTTANTVCSFLLTSQLITGRF